MSKVKNTLIADEGRADALRNGSKAKAAQIVENAQRVIEDLEWLMSQEEGVSEMLERDCQEARCALKHVVRAMA